MIIREKLGDMVSPKGAIPILSMDADTFPNFEKGMFSVNCFTFALPKAKAEKGSKTVTEKCSNGNRDRCDRGDNICGSIPQKSHALTDKNLVYHVVKGIDNQCYDTGNGIACKQFSDFFIAKRIGCCLCVIHSCVLL